MKLQTLSTVLLSSSILALAACGGTTILGDGNGGSEAQPSTSSGAESTGGSGTFMATYPPAACTEPQAGVENPASLDDFTALVIGRWLLCSPPSVFLTTDEQGLEIDADGNWYKLYQVSTGTFERGTGLEKQGTWSAVGSQGSFSLVLNIPGGEVSAFPAFSTTPRLMATPNPGSDDILYALTP